MIIFYTTHCPKCRVLETKLKEKNVEYETVTDINEMLYLGIKEAPMLAIDDRLLSFSEAIKYVNSL